MIQFIKECLHYNPDTGVFTWLRRPFSHFKDGRSYKMWNTSYAGSVAGSNHKDGYRVLVLQNERYMAHRVAWFICYGYWPDQIDHINGVRSDNRIINLREVDNHGNSLNCKRKINNTSGTTGVSWVESRSRWVAYINVNGKRKSLGYHSDKHEAVVARKNAEVKYGYHENHDRPT